MPSEEKYLSYLEKVAEALPARAHRRKRDVLRTRIASCVVIKNEIVSIGVNQLKSHPFQAKFSRNEDSIYLQAETDAIKNALKIVDVEDLERATLYVCRVKGTDASKKQFIRGMCCPCNGCKRAIAAFNIRKVVYTCDDGSYSYL